MPIGHGNATVADQGVTMAVAALAPNFEVRNRWLAAKQRPMVVGHRGVPTLHQENTLAGFRRAMALGIDAIELDVRVTRDGRAVVFHDSSLERLTGVRRSISDLTWDEVAALRVRPVIEVGRRFVRYEREEPISLLAEVLAELGDQIAINIELKPRWLGDDISSIVTADLAASGLTDRVLVTSWDPRKLREVGRIQPAVTLGYCWNDSFLGFGRRTLNRLLDHNVAGQMLGVRAVGADYTLVGADTVRRLHGTGIVVGAHVVFPIDAPPRAAAGAREVERLVSLGVDWIESDDPEYLQHLIG